MSRRKKEERVAEWSDGNKFTLCLALVCRVRSIAACLPALTGNSRLIAKFPLRCCGQPYPHTYTHTKTNATTIIYTDMHVHTLPESHLSAHVCINTVAGVPTEQGPSGPDTQGINKLPFSLENMDPA